ncbi:unnamed protein product [Hymenolepis diminuta]|uniref:Uncharacterized protein n=1 Tax=Hymenolepis diminuta TaxID=6216 RepID=A0A564Y1I7_HYMDI|nr:unnamed protein product [Hymenolepis diminuta]
MTRRGTEDSEGTASRFLFYAFVFHSTERIKFSYTSASISIEVDRERVVVSGSRLYLPSQKKECGGGGGGSKRWHWHPFTPMDGEQQNERCVNKDQNGDDGDYHTRLLQDLAEHANSEPVSESEVSRLID